MTTAVNTVAAQLQEQGRAYVRGKEGAGLYVVTPTRCCPNQYTVEGPGIDRENYESLDAALEDIENVLVTPKHALEAVQKFFQDVTEVGWFDQLAADLDPDYINSICDLVDKVRKTA